MSNPIDATNGANGASGASARDTLKARVNPLPEPRRTSRTGPRRIFQQLDRNAAYPYTRNDYIKRLLWKLVEHTLFRLTPSRLNGVRLRMLRLFGAKLAPTAVVRSSVTIMHPWLLEMGEYACLGERVDVYNLGPIAIGHHTTVSQNCHLCAGTHDHKNPAMPLIRSAIRIGDGCWICADSFIGPDVCIGDNVIVAARTVVMRSVDADLVVAGNPAKVLTARMMDAE